MMSLAALDLVEVQAQNADGGVLHGLGIGAARHREHARDIDADVLDRQGALERISIWIGSRLRKA